MTFGQPNRRSAESLHLFETRSAMRNEEVDRLASHCDGSHGSRGKTRGAKRNDADDFAYGSVIDGGLRDLHR